MGMATERTVCVGGTYEGWNCLGFGTWLKKIGVGTSKVAIYFVTTLVLEDHSLKFPTIPFFLSGKSSSTSPIQQREGSVHKSFLLHLLCKSSRNNTNSF
jgi:hypothetical protein